MQSFPRLHVRLAVVVVAALCMTAPAETIPLYVASPAREGGGIYHAQLDAETGRVSATTRASDVPSSFMTMSADRKFLYSVGDARKPDANGRSTGSVRAFAVNANDRTLSLLNEASSGGRGPCHVALDPTGKFACVANYSGGTASVLPIKADGALDAPSATVTHEGSGPNPKRQTAPHPHSANLTPDGKLLVIADLGLDKLMLYTLDAGSGALAPADPPFVKTPSAGGPRHLDFHPNGRFAYANNEMGCSVTAFTYDGGKFAEIQTIPTIPDRTEADTTSEVQVHPSGTFLYCATRGADQVTAYRLDEQTGKLELIGAAPAGGQVPRHFAIDPTGRWLLVANQKSNAVAVLKIDETTGALSATEHSLELPNPMCIVFTR